MSGNQKFRDSTALLQPRDTKVLYCPHVVGFSLKSAVLSLKNRKNQQPSGLGQIADVVMRTQTSDEALQVDLGGGASIHIYIYICIYVYTCVYIHIYTCPP